MWLLLLVRELSKIDYYSYNLLTLKSFISLNNLSPLWKKFLASPQSTIELFQQFWKILIYFLHVEYKWIQLIETWNSGLGSNLNFILINTIREWEHKWKLMDRSTISYKILKWKTKYYIGIVNVMRNYCITILIATTSFIIFELATSFFVVFPFFSLDRK